MSAGGPKDTSKSGKPKDKPKGKLATRISHAGRDPKATGGMVNPQVQRGSTVLVSKAADLYAPGTRTYGRHGTTTHDALKEALCELEDAQFCAVTASGLLACTIPMFAFAQPGGHVLMADTVYGPTRRFCERTLKRWGCETEFYDPAEGAGVAHRFRRETRVLFIESPGSMTFEIADLPAMAAAARAAGVVTVADNTWAAGVYHKPLDLGADVSVQSTSKYVSGGADVLGGAIFTNSADLFERMKEAIADLGLAVSPDDAYTVLRGLRSLETRIAQSGASALKVAEWLAQQPDVAQVIHPALPGDANHELWARDFTGSSGLFGLALRKVSTKQVHAFLDALTLFGLGFSYGGFESLAIHCDPQLKRTVAKPELAGPLIRLSIGLEDPDDLIADLERGFAALRSA